MPREHAAARDARILAKAAGGAMRRRLAAARARQRSAELRRLLDEALGRAASGEKIGIYVDPANFAEAWSYAVAKAGATRIETGSDPKAHVRLCFGPGLLELWQETPIRCPESTQ